MGILFILLYGLALYIWKIHWGGIKIFKRLQKKYTIQQGYKGIRWPKMVGPNGIEAPSSVGPLLIWQQPHFIIMQSCYTEKKHPVKSWNSMLICRSNSRIYVRLCTLGCGTEMLCLRSPHLYLLVKG